MASLSVQFLTWNQELEWLFPIPINPFGNHLNTTGLVRSDFLIELGLMHTINCTNDYSKDLKGPNPIKKNLNFKSNLNSLENFKAKVDGHNFILKEDFPIIRKFGSIAVFRASKASNSLRILFSLILLVIGKV